MSALAARRAAVAARKADEKNQLCLKESALPTAAESTQNSEDYSVSEQEALLPSPKRRRTKNQEPRETNSRHFSKFPNSTVNISQPQAIIKDKISRTLLSEPAIENDLSGLDALMSDSDEDTAEDNYGEDEGRADERITPCSMPPISAGYSGHASPKYATPTVSIEVTSTFQPQENVNFFKLSEEKLSRTGIKYGNGPGVIFSLGRDESLAVAGIFTITPLQGALTLYHTTISPSSIQPSHPVFAPTSHPLPIISPSNFEGDLPPSIAINNINYPPSFQRKEKRILFLITENHCGLDGMRFGAIPGFTNIWLGEEDSWGLKGVYPVVKSSPTPVYPYVPAPSWTTALSTASSPSLDSEESFIALVKGPKRSGKSTFARALLNRLLAIYEKVCWLECDLGQGEFSCGGIAGLWIIENHLFGPPFTHPAVPMKAFYLGTYTPMACPDEYMAAIQSLLEHYRYEIQYPLSSSSSSSKITNRIPLIINTQGWIKGLGEDLLRAVENLAEPNRVFAFKQESPEGDERSGWSNSPQWKNSQLPYDPSYPAGMTDGIEKEKKVFELEQAPTLPLQARYTPADLRVLSIITYFHSTLPPSSSISNLSWDLTSPLLTIPPYKVSLSPTGPLSKAFLIGEGSEGVLEEDLGLALNGAVVALVEIIAEEEEDGKNILYRPGRKPLACDCLGLAFIRGLSPSTTGYDLHLLTPLPPTSLSRATAIIKNGLIELPLPGLLDWRRGGVTEDGMVGRCWDEVPFLDITRTEVIAGERRRWRRNIGRKGM
ncbi:uncharacterized protein L203_105820 [Cryptococcus depauperatus CBS 7841]|uniref:Polynucleotide 5'-hydroxyl-kinase GRC3 n=1 Tax=Cryptococcus depauperatus CBS 7841 TaxID=1295531 RepID=A0AAJ8M2W8_9TREE